MSFLQKLVDYHDIPFGKDVFFYHITKYHEILCILFDKGVLFYDIAKYHMAEGVFLAPLGALAD